MNDEQLNEILKSGRVPEQPTEYWEEFPAQVTRRIRRSADSPVRASAPEPRFFRRPAFLFSIGLAVVCLIAGFWMGRWRGSPATKAETTFAEAQKYYREIAQLFPNQVRAIVFDQTGTHLVLAERADVPAASPVFMKICGPEGCRGIVTFSGQQIRVNGKPMDVLVGPMDEVILAGPDSLWSTKQNNAQIGQYRIEAETLHAQL